MSDDERADAAFEEVVARAARAQAGFTRWRRAYRWLLPGVCVALVAGAFVALATRVDAFGAATAALALALWVITVVDAVISARVARALVAEEAARAVRRSLRQGGIEL